MKRTLLRVYDREDKTSMTGECYWIVLDGTFEELSDYDLEIILQNITKMPWQRYTSWAIGTADINDDELFWSEILSYEMHEVCIDASRVDITHKFKLPTRFTGLDV